MKLWRPWWKLWARLLVMWPMRIISTKWGYVHKMRIISTFYGYFHKMRIISMERGYFPELWRISTERGYSHKIQIINMTRTKYRNLSHNLNGPFTSNNWKITTLFQKYGWSMSNIMVSNKTVKGIYLINICTHIPP